jgi:hypothetical protein
MQLLSLFLNLFGVFRAACLVVMSQEFGDGPAVGTAEEVSDLAVAVLGNACPTDTVDGGLRVD